MVKLGGSLTNEEAEKRRRAGPGCITGFQAFVGQELIDLIGQTQNGWLVGRNERSVNRSPSIRVVVHL